MFLNDGDVINDDDDDDDVWVLGLESLRLTYDMNENLFKNSASRFIRARLCHLARKLLLQRAYRFSEQIFLCYVFKLAIPNSTKRKL